MRFLVRWLPLCFLLAGCTQNPIKPPPPPPSDATLAIRRMIGAYEQKKSAEYQRMFTGDFTYEFSSGTDSTLRQQYWTGWFKPDEKEASNHLFNGYTPPGGETLPAATGIDINLAVDTPADDNASGLDPVTHKVLATRVDGSVTLPQNGPTPLTYVIRNNYDIFYLVRGDQAVNLDGTQSADVHHWYIYRWVDVTAPQSHSDSMTVHYATWGRIKGQYH